MAAAPLVRVHSGAIQGDLAAEFLHSDREDPLRIVFPPGTDTLHLLVIDDDAPVLRACCEIAAGMGFAVHAAASAEVAREMVRSRSLDMVLMDLKMPGGGLALLEDIRAQRPRTSIVVMTAFATVSSAVEAMRIGATDYLTKPFAMDELTGVLQRAGQRRHFELESRRLEERLHTQRSNDALIGASAVMEKLFRILSKVAFSSHPVLIVGESGTGKEVVARTIHANGPNAAKPFLAVECGARQSALLESDLFGHARGAFTGANRSHPGLLGAEGGGTLFLDEVSELPLDLQARLLRALQEKQFKPAGASQAIPVTVRVLAAAHRDLTLLVEQGSFRKDLFYRLNVVNLRIPPLRERRADIPLLAEHFLDRMRVRNGRPYHFAADATQMLTAYDWPGNVRELESAVERACSMASGPALYAGDLPTQLQPVGSGYGMSSLLRVDARRGGAASAIADGMSPPPIVSIAEMERQAILNTIRQLKGDKLMAAKLLGIGKTTLYRKLKEYGITDF